MEKINKLNSSLSGITANFKETRVVNYGLTNNGFEIKADTGESNNIFNKLANLDEFSFCFAKMQAFDYACNFRSINNLFNQNAKGEDYLNIGRYIYFCNKETGEVISLSTIKNINLIPSTLLVLLFLHYIEYIHEGAEVISKEC